MEALQKDDDVIVVGSGPGGATVAGELSGQNKVDSNVKTEIHNLYVRDCSIIPDANGQPPTLTIFGLGKRPAKHLLAEKSR